MCSSTRTSFMRWTLVLLWKLCKWWNNIQGWNKQIVSNTFFVENSLNVSTCWWSSGTSKFQDIIKITHITSYQIENFNYILYSELNWITRVLELHILFRPTECRILRQINQDIIPVHPVILRVNQDIHLDHMVCFLIYRYVWAKLTFNLDTFEFDLRSTSARWKLLPTSVSSTDGLCSSGCWIWATDSTSASSRIWTWAGWSRRYEMCFYLWELLEFDIPECCSYWCILLKTLRFYRWMDGPASTSAS